MWLWMWTTLAVAAPDCPADPYEVTIRSAAAIEKSFVDLDDAAFDLSAAGLDRALPCVDVQLSRDDAALLHRAMAIRAFVEADDRGSQRAWTAARVLQPAWEPSPALMPVDHPMRELWNNANPDGLEVELQRPPPGGWVVDGSRSELAPRSQSFVLQGLGRQGQVLHTGYHWTATTVPFIEDLDDPATVSRRKRIRVVGTSVSGALLLGAAGSGVVYKQALQEWRSDTPLTPGEAEALKQKVNRSLATTSVLGVAGAVGMGVTWGVRW